MELGRIDHDLTWAEFVTVRMLRRCAASAQVQANTLPSMVALAEELGLASEVAISLHSVFQLAEATLGRRLETECCCNRDLSSDERAVLMLIAVGLDRPPPFATRHIPHGLPGALCWAVASARLAMGIEEAGARPIQTAGCPFERT